MTNKKGRCHSIQPFQRKCNIYFGNKTIHRLKIRIAAMFHFYVVRTRLLFFIGLKVLFEINFKKSDMIDGI